MQKTPIFLYHIPHPKDNRIAEGYVGVTKNLESRFENHARSDSLVGKGIRKYDLSFSCVRVIGKFYTRSDALKAEKAFRPLPLTGWNLAPGGQGGYSALWTPERKRAMAEKMSGEGNPFFGRKHDNQSRKNISKGLMNKDAAWRVAAASKAGKANLGVKKSEEGKKNMSKSALNRPKFECPHCGKIGQYNSMIAWHGDNCKKREVG